jgi:hypothetical protein
MSWGGIQSTQFLPPNPEHLALSIPSVNLYSTMSNAETIDNTWSDPEISSGPEILSDAEMGDDERPSGSRRASHVSFLPSSISDSIFESICPLTHYRSQERKTDNIYEHNRGSAHSVEAAILTFARDIRDGKLQTIENGK